MTRLEIPTFQAQAGPIARKEMFLMTEDDRKQSETGTSPARTWTVTLGISFAVLFAMYGLAFMNDAHIRVATPALIGTASGAPCR